MASVALQSKGHRDLLDIIDNLRSKGIRRYVDLPEIVVCGDQSAGKSSVLEAISGMSFPTKDNLCTRFATELILRRDTASTVSISIIPGPERTAEEKEYLYRFHHDVDMANLNLGSVVKKATKAMGLSGAKVFSTDTLRVELCSPTQPHLTMVDLPGIFRAGNKDQSVNDAKTVREMVRGYMERPRSIILAVVSAKSDFALQEVTELARELDPSGTRTLGLITKPDTLDTGSDSEAAYLRLAQNKDVVFRLGWHVLKNRSYEMRDSSPAERDEAEEAFFSMGVWTSMDESHLGVKALKPRLSNVLKEQIILQLPGLLQDLESGISRCRDQLERLGTSRATLAEQHRYLLHVSKEFTALIKAAVDGHYNDPFFGSAKTWDGYEKRLRARVQNALTEFEGNMRQHGQYRIITNNSVQTEGDPSRLISRSDYIDEVKGLMKKSRGRELPGTFSPLIIGELFTEQCQPWEFITINVKDAILEAVFQTTKSIIDYLCVDETADGILRLVSEGINSLKTELNRKVKELLDPHSKGHPITFNHYLVDNVERAQRERRRLSYEMTFKKLLGGSCFNGEYYKVQPPVLLDRLEKQDETDMERYASDLAVDYMEAYYKVALKRFVDDVGVLAIENCLIGKLPFLFDAEVMYDLTEDEIARLAGESKDTATKRQQCTEKMVVLAAGLRDLQHHKPCLIGQYTSIGYDKSSKQDDIREASFANIRPPDHTVGEQMSEVKPQNQPLAERVEVPSPVEPVVMDSPCIKSVESPVQRRTDTTADLKIATEKYVKLLRQRARKKKAIEDGLGVGLASP